MSGKPWYRSFFVKAALIVVMGAAIMVVVTGGIVLATNAPATVTAAPVSGNYNTAGSYGITGYPALSVNTSSSNVPSFIKNPLAEKRGVILLVYCAGVTEDQQMLTYFNTVKAKYAAQGSFFSFESAHADRARRHPRPAQDHPAAGARRHLTRRQCLSGVHRLDQREGHVAGRRQRPRQLRALPHPRDPSRRRPHEGRRRRVRGPAARPGALPCLTGGACVVR